MSFDLEALSVMVTFRGLHTSLHYETLQSDDLEMLIIVKLYLSHTFEFVKIDFLVMYVLRFKDIWDSWIYDLIETVGFSF